MKAGGIGGVESTVIRLALERQSSPTFRMIIDALRFAAAKAHVDSVDMTLGSGWPYGGPMSRSAQAASRLRVEHPEAAAARAVPSLEEGENCLQRSLVGADRLAGVRSGRFQVSLSRRVYSSSPDRPAGEARPAVTLRALFSITIRPRRDRISSACRGRQAAASIPANPPVRRY